MYNLYDRFKGETCIVIGNGPSLKDVSNEYLVTHHTFGSNRVYLKYVPTFFVCVNPLVIQQNWVDIASMNTEKFVREGSEIDDAYELHPISLPMFSYNPYKWLYEGHTVTFVSLQLAFFMGFHKVILVGVDHRYKFEGKPNEERLMEDDDPNHFDPEYFKGMKWHNPDLRRSEEAYMMAKEAYESDGREIINITRDSALEVFKKEELVWVP